MKKPINQDKSSADILLEVIQDMHAQEQIVTRETLAANASTYATATVSSIYPMIERGAGKPDILAALDRLIEVDVDRMERMSELQLVCFRLKTKLERIEIVRAEPPVFYATIVVLADGEERKIDARPSDAIALAVRSNAPMFVEDDIMNRLGTVSTHAEEVDDEQEFEKFDEFVHTLSPDDF